ncbi:MAG: WD40 repeat domain-containing protein [Bacteroidales bacterium]|nr:WD40 repeat domain-containing protein [Bacteroidales bacterium]
MKQNPWSRFWKSYVDERVNPNLNQTMPKPLVKIAITFFALLLVVFLLTYILPRQGAKRMRASSQQIDCIAFSPVGHRLATISPDNELLFWDVENGKREGGFYCSVANIHTRSMMFSPDGNLLLVAPEKGVLSVFDITNGWPVRDIPSSDSVVMEFRSASFSPDGEQIATAVGNRVDIWKSVADEKPQLKENFSYEELLAHIEAGKQPEMPLQSINTGGAVLNDIVYSRDGQAILTAAADGKVCLWDVATASLVQDFQGHRGEVFDAEFSSDGNTLVTASADSTIRLWDVATGKERLCIAKHKGVVRSVALAPDGSWLASASDDGTVAVWNAATGKRKKHFEPGGDKWSVVAVSPDGRYLAASSKIARVSRGSKYNSYYTYESYVYLWKVKWTK